MDPDGYFFRNRVLLAIQRALVGQVTPEMRAIAAEWSAEPAWIALFVHVDRPIDPGLAHDIRAEVTAALRADFEPGTPEIRVEFARTDPDRPLEWRGWLVYGRRERDGGAGG